MHTAFRNTAIGIIGWGAGRKANESCGLGPTVFSRVTEVKNWIANHTVGDAVFDSKCKRINGEWPTLYSMFESCNKPELSPQIIYVIAPNTFDQFQMLAVTGVTGGHGEDAP